MPAPRETVSTTALLRVDRVLCTAHGVCASLLPDSVRLDEWGYPVVVDARVGEEEARAAVTLCPARALYVQHR